MLTKPEHREKLLNVFPDDNPGRKAIAMVPVVTVVCRDPAESDVENGIDYFTADVAIAF